MSAPWQLALITLSGLLGCADKADDTAGGDALLDVYTLSDDDQFPEGVAFHAGERAFFLSSLTTGAVTRLDADGAESTLYTPGAGWMSLGMKLDGDTLAVCAVYGYGQEDTTGAIWAFDATTGAVIADVDLSAAFAGANCNDVAFDGGYVYVTDRENPNLYRVDLAAGSAELWLTDPALEPGIIGMNGIVVTPGGELLVGKYSPAELLRVPLADPSALALVALSGDEVGSLPDGFDGIAWDGDALVIAGNSELYRLTSGDDWGSAAVSAVAPGAAIAAVTVAEGRVYGLKGEVVPFVLGTDIDLPFELRAIE